MSDFQVIENALKATSARHRLQRAWAALWKGLLAGGAVWLVVFGVYKVVPIPVVSLTAAGIAAGVTLLAFLAVAVFRRESLVEAARWLDEKQNLQQRLSTALEVSRSPESEWKQLVVSDAAGHVRGVDPRKLAPLRWPKASRWALLVLALGAGLAFVPEYRSKAYVKKQQDTQHVRETGKQMAQFTRQQLAQKPPTFDETQKSIESVAEFGEKLGKASLT